MTNRKQWDLPIKNVRVVPALLGYMRASLPYVRELIQLAKSSPKPLHYGTPT